MTNGIARLVSVGHPGLVPGSLTMRVRDPPDEPGDDNGVAGLVSVRHPGPVV